MPQNKFEIQDSQYAEPYHHFVSMDGNFYKELPWGLEYYGYISRVMHYVGNGKVADVGCGDGKLIFELAKKFPDSFFHGYDLSERAVQFAKAYSHGFTNVEFNFSDFSESNGDFDVITCIETLEHVPDKDITKFVGMLYEKISKNGTLIITVPTTVVPLNKKHYRHYDEKLLKKQLEGKFEIIKFEWVHDGKGSWLIRHLLANRFWILKFEPLRKFLVNLYNKFFLITDSKRGEHLLAVCKPI